MSNCAMILFFIGYSSPKMFISLYMEMTIVIRRKITSCDFICLLICNLEIAENFKKHPKPILIFQLAYLFRNICG